VNTLVQNVKKSREKEAQVDLVTFILHLEGVFFAQVLGFLRQLLSGEEMSMSLGKNSHPFYLPRMPSDAFRPMPESFE